MYLLHIAKIKHFTLIILSRPSPWKLFTINTLHVFTGSFLTNSSPNILDEQNIKETSNKFNICYPFFIYKDELWVIVVEQDKNSTCAGNEIQQERSNFWPLNFKNWLGTLAFWIESSWLFYNISYCWPLISYNMQFMRFFL